MPSSTKNKIKSIAFVISVLVPSLILYRYFTFSNEASKGKIAPEFSVKLIDKRDYNLSDSKGNYIILDFWGSWCHTCLGEMPKLVDLKSKFQSSYFDNKSKLDIVTIALEKKGDNWRKVTQKFGFNWDFQAVSYNKFVLSSSIANKYGVLDLPSKFLINPKGYIVLSKTTFEEIESYLDNIEI
jgi:thiol-disulfide isomerase/thioredoxin